MGKHKTRKEKIISDLRKKLAVQTSSVSFTSNNFKLPSLKQPVSSIQTSFIYTHESLSSDLLKTLFLTSSLIISEIIIFFLLKNQILKLPIAGF